MSALYMMVTITSRKLMPKFISFYKENNAAICLVTLGKGTATSEMMSFFGLDTSEKAVIFTVVTDTVWATLKHGLQRKLQIDIPGTGIAFIIPLSSIGGKRELRFLTENQDYKKGEEAILKGTTRELLMVIANQGYIDPIMDAARSKGATGGTVIHARGTGLEQAERFLGVSLAAEKEIIFIITKSEDKNQIMQEIMLHNGMESKAKAIIISLPVTSTAGLRLLEESDQPDQAAEAAGDQAAPHTKGQGQDGRDL